jgi:hypothetical protein
MKNIFPIDEKFIYTDENGDSFVEFEPDKPLLKIGEGISITSLYVTYINSVPKLIIGINKENDDLNLKKKSLETLSEISQNIAKVNKRNAVFVKNDLSWTEESNYLNGIDRLDMLVEDLDEKDDRYYKSINHLAKSKYA